MLAPSPSGNAALHLAAYGERTVAGSGPETSKVRGGEDRLDDQPSPEKWDDDSVQARKAVTGSRNIRLPEWL